MLIVMKAAISYQYIFQLIVVSAVKDCNGTGPLSAIFIRWVKDKSDSLAAYFSQQPTDKI